MPILRPTAAAALMLSLGVPFAVRGEDAAAPAKPVTAPVPAAAKADPDLPQPVDARDVQSLVTNPPFTRALNLSDSLALTGMAYVDGKPVATILNRETKQSFVVSEEPNAQGWKLAETNASKNLQRAEVKIMAGAEIVTVRYGEEQLTPGAKKPGPPSQGPGGPPPPGGPPSGDNRFRTSSLLGDEGREKYYSLPDNVRDRFRDTVRQYREQNPNASMEQLSTFARKEFEKAQSDSQRDRR
ncbi:MAG TPA: hypothetical protein VLE43_02760 [Candidatus Saccharimonadia bacterium]|nr:hypothetical protein [Candidatus Saccharimonadia bacterium]